MIIVSGRLRIKNGERANFLASSQEAMKQARVTEGCRDFVVAADPLEEDRVNVYEEWETRESLVAFRGSGPDDAMTELITDAKMTEHIIED